MTSDQIINLVKKYINKTYYNYAILIDGNWGAGKTYFVKKMLIPNIKEDEESKFKMHQNYKKKEIIYISLYDLTSKDELIKQLLIKTMPQDKLLESKHYNAILSSNERIITGASISSENRINSNNEFISLENCIIIFDDLERCNMSVNVILGYINNFVEHHGIKVILIANEKEISTSQMTINKELKYLIALNDNIEFPKENGAIQIKNASGNSPNNSDTSNQMSITKLDKRINLLFGEDKLYKLIKEKLIGVTIGYKANIVEIINQIVKDNNINGIVKNIIFNNKDYIKDKFEHYDHQNIRTLLFAIDKFKDLVTNLRGKIVLKKSEDILNEIFQYIIKVSIFIKSGKSLYRWPPNSEVDQICMDKDFKLSNFIKGFKFIDIFLSKSLFEKDKIVNIIKRDTEIKRMQVKDVSDSLYKLNNGWWTMEDGKAKDAIDNVIMSIKDDPKHYDIVNYSKILSHVITLNIIGVTSIEISDVLKIMKKNIKIFEVNSDFDIFGFGNPFNEKEEQQQYSEAINELKEEFKRIKEQAKINTLKSIIINSKDWTKNLYNYVQKNRDEFLLQRTFLGFINFNELVNAIKFSSSAQITDFRSIINHIIYSFDNLNEFYKADKEIIDNLRNDLVNYINEIEDKQKIKANNIKYLINDLKRISEKLS